MGVSVESEIVFQVECVEKAGTFVRKARPMNHSVEDAVHVLQRLRGLPSMFSATPMRTIRPIWDALDAGWEILMVDDVGLLAVGNTMIERHIDVHITFWDRVLRGREKLAETAIAWAMVRSGAIGVYTAVPASSKATIAFAKRVGFVVHGWMLDGATDRFGQTDDSVVLRHDGD